MSIIQTVTPTTHDLGGFEVRRAVPSPSLRMVGPFVFVDQFGPSVLDIGKGMDVRPHLHINLATVTWMFEGAIARERIEQAKEDWREGRFAKVPGDEVEFIPLPAKPKTVNYP